MALGARLHHQRREALEAYPEYSKVVERDGRLVVAGKLAALRHRLSIGTIVSESAMKVQLLRGRTIGTVEENFIARLRPGDVFTFAGRVLEFVRVRDMIAHVRRSTAKSTSVPHWSGARMPLSPQLAALDPDQAGRGATGDVSRPRDGGGARHPGAPGVLVANSRGGRAPDRTSEDPRGAPPLPLPDRRATGPRGTRRALRLPDRPARPDHLHPGGQRLRPRAPLARSRAARGGDGGRAALARSTCCTTSPPASTPRSWLDGSSGRSRGSPGLVFQGYPGAATSA